MSKSRASHSCGKGQPAPEIVFSFYTSSENIIQRQDEFGREEEGFVAGSDDAAAGWTAVANIAGVTAPETEAEIEIEVGAEHLGVAGADAYAVAVPFRSRAAAGQVR